jgi:hypothetical protein
MDSKQILEWDLSSTWMDPRPIKALVLQCSDLAQKQSIPSALGSIPHYSRLKYIPLTFNSRMSYICDGTPTPLTAE